MLGGEHSISLGAIQAYQAKYRDMSILQIDAHSDLRDTWENSAYNHACVMRRAAESVKRVVQVGIRSQDSTEALYASEHKDQVRIFYGDDVPTVGAFTSGIFEHGERIIFDLPAFGREGCLVSPPPSV